MKVLAIETSCDETAVAVVEGDRPDRPFRILANQVYSQIELHRQYGGVFPEQASREHIKKIGWVLEAALEEAMGDEARITNNELRPRNRTSKFELRDSINLRHWLAKEIGLIAVTKGPGLIGSLLVGVNLAKTLAYTLGKPILGINHHEGHIAAAFLESHGKSEIRDQRSEVPKLPAVALVVSGGHTQLVLLKAMGKFEVLGRTRDDAAGEAYDKTARLIGLPYPGGPAIEALAAKYEGRITNNGVRSSNRHAKFVIPDSLWLPRPMIDSGDLDFSFSGLKTAVARWVAEHEPLDDEKKRLIAWSIQETIGQVLAVKTEQAVKEYHPKSVIVCGGVAANQRLRQEIALRISNQELGIRPTLHIPLAWFCTDNAAMIGAAALLRALAGQKENWYDITADDSLRL